MDANQLIEDIYKLEKNNFIKAHHERKKPIHTQVVDEIKKLRKKVKDNYLFKEGCVNTSQLKMEVMDDAERVSEFSRKKDAFYDYKQRKLAGSFDLSFNNTKLSSFKPLLSLHPHMNIVQKRFARSVNRKQLGRINEVNDTIIRKRVRIGSNKEVINNNKSWMLDKIIKKCIREEDCMGKSLDTSSRTMIYTKELIDNYKQTCKKIERLSYASPITLRRLYDLEQTELDVIRTDTTNYLKQIRHRRISPKRLKRT